MNHRTLLLSPWYVPIQILQWQDAVKMRYEGTAEVIAEYEQEICSPSVKWHIPAVMRLRRMPRAKQRGIKFSRVNVYQRDNFCCQYCGKRFPVGMLSYDHVVPRAAGGRTCWENIVTACRACNTRKGHQSCDAAGMWPMKDPWKPKTLPFAGPLIDRGQAPDEWLAFLPA
ncbi:MAG TPA: HNH endonuclease [Polyangiaceae bacterium]|nr:HNH endonuclease [Polyangiaceae bacterium]